MACTYDYQNGQITLDFHFVECGTKCLFSGLPAKAGNKRCKQCPHYGGLLTCATLGVEYWGRFNEDYETGHYKDKDRAVSELLGYLDATKEKTEEKNKRIKRYSLW